MSKYCTIGLRKKLESEGIRWMPPAFYHFDNYASNYDFRNDTEKAYQKAIEKQNETIKWFEDIDEDGIGYDEEDKYTWLKKPIEEKLKAPDADFSYDGIHKSMIPGLGFGDKNTRRKHFSGVHKGNRYSKIRVPSMKRSKTEWQKFYNVFPDIAAQVRLGNRRFINGAKLKYIW